MSVFQHGIPINIVERFATVDPLTEVVSPGDPTTVVFTLEADDASQTVYTWGLDPEVTNPAVGAYVLTLDPPAPGHYDYVCVGTGAIEAESPGSFDVLPDGVLAPLAPAPTGGPCTSWIDGDAVADCDSTLGVGSSTFLLDDVAAMSSWLLFELSGRQFSGTCERTHRPCRDRCSCWTFAAGGSPGAWGWGWAWQSAFAGGGSWRNECGDRCGCGSESYVTLPGHPIRHIVQVKIDGSVVPAGEYRLDAKRELLRLDDPGPPVVHRTWPACQNLALADDQPGTFSVRYLYGVDPPEAGKIAAAQLAGELFKACPGNTGECRLPNKVTKVVRQGITIEKLVPLAEMLKTGATGLQLVDAFIAGANPRGIRRRPAVWSPDVRSMGRRTG